jgi:hypothetical protein
MDNLIKKIKFACVLAFFSLSPLCSTTIEKMEEKMSSRNSRGMQTKKEIKLIVGTEVHVINPSRKKLSFAIAQNRKIVKSYK